MKYESINDALTLNVGFVFVTHKCYIIESKGPKRPRKESLQINISKINFNAKNILDKDHLELVYSEDFLTGSSLLLLKE